MNQTWPKPPKKPQYKAKSRQLLVFTLSLQKGFPKKNACHAQALSICLQNTKPTTELELKNQQKCKEHNKKNLKGKYMLGFSPVKLYRVFHQPTFTLDSAWVRWLDFKPILPFNEEGMHLKKTHLFLAAIKNNAFAVKYCLRLLLVVLLQVHMHASAHKPSN